MGDLAQGTLELPQKVRPAYALQSGAWGSLCSCYKHGQMGSQPWTPVPEASTLLTLAWSLLPTPMGNTGISSDPG